MMRVTVWNEFRHERTNPQVASVYPDGIHEALAEPLRRAGHEVRTATLDEPEHGLGDEVLDDDRRAAVVGAQGAWRRARRDRRARPGSACWPGWA